MKRTSRLVTVATVTTLFAGGAPCYHPAKGVDPN